MESKPLYVATFMSFVYVAGYLLVECFFYHSVHAASIAPYCFIAGTVATLFMASKCLPSLALTDDM
jgi:hypothetical protein